METKNIILKLLIVILMICIFLKADFSYAAKDDTTELMLSYFRYVNGESVNGYALRTYTGNGEARFPIYQIMSTTKDTNYFCVNANEGDSWLSGNSRATYNRSYDLNSSSDLNSLATNTNSVYRKIAESNYLKQVLWILDNAYISSNVPETERTEQKRELLSKAGLVFGDVNNEETDGTVTKGYKYVARTGYDYTDKVSEDAIDGYFYYDTNSEYHYVELTDDLIETAEQAAIWYYTNYLDNNEEHSEKYNVKDLGLQLACSNGVTVTDTDLWKALNGPTFEVETDIENHKAEVGKWKQEQATILCWYLIDAANNYAQTSDLQETGDPLTITPEKANVTEKNVNNGNFYVVGPIKIEEKNNIECNLINSIIINGNASTEAYISDAEGNRKTTQKISSYIGKEFYVAVPTSAINGKEINIRFDGTYRINEKKLLINTTKTEQPIIKVTPNDKTFGLETTAELTGVYVQKVWDDNNNRAGRRPTSINVSLMKGNTIVQTVELNESNNWKHFFLNLPKTENGIEINYTVKEIDHIENYETTMSGDIQNGFIITNKYRAFDLALRKAIIKISNKNGEEKQVLNEANENAERNITYIAEDIAQNGTATYNHRKDPVVVKKGDIVTYSLTIYNEGDKAGYANTIIDKLPQGLVPANESGTYKKGNVEYSYEYNSETKELIFTNVSKNDLSPYNNTNKISQETIEIDLIITAEPTTTSNKYLTNIAYISSEHNSEDNKDIVDVDGEDRDSTPSRHPTSEQEKEGTTYNGYKGNESNKSVYEGTNNTYYKGQEDDDDFEIVVLEPVEFDLKLIKHIEGINNIDKINEESIRKITVDTTNLNKVVDGKKITTADYDVSKVPVNVKTGDYVMYTFEIYNEGEVDGYAEKISEDIPEGLKFLKETDENLSEEDRRVIEWNNQRGWVEDGNNISTDYLSKAKSAHQEIPEMYSPEQTPYLKTETNLIKAYTEEMNYGPDKVSVSVILKVTAKNVKNIIRNEAEIADDADYNGNEVNDRDSVPEEWEKKNSTDYYENNTEYPKYEQDDEDYDNIRVLNADLALTKFITAISEDINIEDGEYLTADTTSRKAGSVENPYTRQTKVNTIPLKNGENDAIYTRIKTPITVLEKSYVLYNIRVYNEGELDVYAGEVTDYLPNYLDFVKGHPINDEYEWSNDTDERIVKTRYLSSENGNDKILKAFDKENDNGEGSGLDYYDLPIVCRVNSNAPNETKLINSAEITEYQDENGNPIPDDIDSKPNNIPEKNKEQRYEDDDDWEVIKVRIKEFDLALRKAIIKISNKNGEEKQVLNEANENAERNITYIAEDIAQNGTATYNHRKDPVVVKKGDIVTYSLTVYNEGEEAGYANTIIDKLPQGLVPAKESGTYKKGNVEYSYEYNSETKELIFTNVSKNDLSPYNNTNKISQETIEIDLIITAEPTTTSNKYLTNIAYISSEHNSEDNKDIVDVDGEDRDSTPSRHPTSEQEKEGTTYNGYKGNESNKSVYEGTNNTYYKGQEDDDDFEIVVLEPVEFDLKLIKHIEGINNIDKINEESIRKITVDTTNLNKVVDGKKITTADYDVSKVPVNVKTGDYVMYTFEIYNEGEVDGYAEKISEDIPEGLKFLKETDENLSEEDRRVIEWNNQRGWVEDGNNISTDYLSKAKSAHQEIPEMYSPEQTPYLKTETNLIKAYTEEMNYGPDKVSVSVILKVTAKNVKNIIRNEAEIADDADYNGNEVNDRDSVPEEWEKKNSTDYYENNAEYPKYEQDDEDYDNIKVLNADLALTKFITAISEDINIEDGEYLTKDSTSKNAGSINNPYIRAPKVDTTPLKNGTDTNAIYTRIKDSLVIPNKSYVLYNIRVYNEGELDLYAGEVTDYLPNYLSFIECDFNTSYGWKVEKDGKTVKTSYLSSKNGKDKILKAFDKENDNGNGSGLHYYDLPILVRVSSNTPEGKKLINTAEITEYQDEDGKIIPEDVDSKPDNVPEKNKEQRYEDDDDWEVIEIKKKRTDLALSKFIAAVSNDLEISNGEYLTKNGQIGSKTNPYIRATNVDTTPLINGTSTDAIYTMVKDTLIVPAKSYVLYNIRVYNEGETDVYAGEVTDHLPNYLDYIDCEFNKNFGWTNPNGDGKTIKTSYLSYENGVKNLLKAFNKKEDDGKGSALDYRDLQVLCKINNNAPSNTNIVNVAEITEYQNEDGDPIPEDIDSTPDNVSEKNEDDDDYEVVQIKTFDLSLLKYVTEVIVTEDGKTTTTQTGNTGDDSKDIIPKVEVNRKKLSTTIVKFGYTIKITNEGDIAGYAKEITDYVPKGLKFYAEDNQGWTDEGNNVISTRLLENKLLQPGESAQVKVILRWINGSTNLGLKTNTAEISEDYNDEGIPDRDSTPDNKVPGEDDIDDAPVLLSIKTGLSDNFTFYISIWMIILISFGAGIIAIKKYVI